VLAQTVPDSFKTEPVQEMEAWLAGVLRGTDSSLLDEWEKLRDPNYKPDEVEEKPVEAPDITRNKREFTALIRTEIFRYMQQLIGGKIDLPELDDYYADHDRIRLDNEARNGRHTYVEPSEDGQSLACEPSPHRSRRTQRLAARIPRGFASGPRRWKADAGVCEHEPDRVMGE
jgi:hypothetical protein